MKSLQLQKPRPAVWIVLATAALFFVLYLAVPSAMVHRTAGCLAALSAYAFLWLAAKGSALCNPAWRGKLPLTLGVSFVFFFVLFLFNKDIPYVWDAWGYMEAGRVIMDKGFFHPEVPQVRGYCLPLLVGLASRTLSFFGTWAERLSLFIISSAVYALGFAWLLPVVLEKLTGRATDVFMRLLVPVLLCLFQWGLMVYPLSDTWALITLMLVVLSLWQLCRAEQEKPWTWFAFWGLLLGVSLYFTYNIRTMYILILIPVGVQLLAWIIRRHGLRQLAAAVCICAGLVAAAAPQVAWNVQHRDRFTPLVISPLSEGKSLISWQLWMGLGIQRYETYNGPAEVYSFASIHYLDPAGLSLRETLPPELEMTMQDYLHSAIRRPFSFLGAYGRHLLNALDNRFPEVYISDLTRSRAPDVVFSFLLWFMGALGLCWRYGQVFGPVSGLKANLGVVWGWVKSKGLFFLTLLIAPVASVAGAIEIRFFFAVYLLLYGWLGLLVPQKEFWLWVKKHLPVILLAALAAFLLLNSAWTATMAQTELPINLPG